MALYNARRAPNVSQYLANLNALPSAHDANQSDENFNIDDELAQFTNTEFLDFDTGNFLEQPVPDFNPEQDEQGEKRASAHNGDLDVKAMDFVNGAFPFADISSFLPTEQQPPLSQPLQNHYAAPDSLPDTLFPSPTSPVSFNPAPYPGRKHPLSSPPAPNTSSTPSQEPETAASRMAAEEDKRRRNTAASARFRVKKKQREQALEQSAKELENKTLTLEQRIGQLEMENEWLRGLVVEKRGGEKEDLRLRWKRDGVVKDGGRRAGEGRKGVGTEEGEKA